MKFLLWVLGSMLLVQHTSSSQTFLPLTAKAPLSSALDKARASFAPDVQLLLISFVGVPPQPSLDIQSGMGLAWVYMFASQQRDSIVFLSGMNIQGQGVYFSVGGGPPYSFTQSHGMLTEPCMDSPDALLAFKNGSASSFLAAHPDVKITRADLTNTLTSIGGLPAGQFWHFRAVSLRDTLDCYQDATTGASILCATTTGLQDIPSLYGFRLDQNFPNPVSLRMSTRTSIQFAIAHGQQVRLSVSDLLGREIRVLQEGWTEAGEHVITLPLDMPGQPGMYIYRLVTATGSASRRFVVQD